MMVWRTMFFIREAMDLLHHDLLTIDDVETTLVDMGHAATIEVVDVLMTLAESHLVDGGGDVFARHLCGIHLQVSGLLRELEHQFLWCILQFLGEAVMIDHALHRRDDGIGGDDTLLIGGIKHYVGTIHVLDEGVPIVIGDAILIRPLDVLPVVCTESHLLLIALLGQEYPVLVIASLGGVVGKLEVNRLS